MLGSMTRFILAVVGGLVCWTAHAADQTCPAPAFERPSLVNLKTSDTSHNILFRQPGGGYTALEIRDESPYEVLGKTENFAAQVRACPYRVPAETSSSYDTGTGPWLPLPSGGWAWVKLKTGAGIRVVVFDAAMQMVSEKVYFPPSNYQYPYYNGTKSANQVQFVDLNGDGNADLVATTLVPLFGYTNITGVDVLLGDGAGGFTPASFTQFTGSLHNWIGSYVLAEVNGDGKLDLVASYDAGFSGHQRVSVFLGNGDGSFQHESVVLKGIDLFNVAVLDWDRDGIPDLLFVNSGSFRYLRGRGDGTFGDEVVIASGSGDFVVTDLDGDGNPDIISGGTVLFGDDKGGIAERSQYFLPGLWWQVVVTDFDGDGFTDIVLGIGTPDVVLGEEIMVLFGRGGRQFAAPQGIEIDFGVNGAFATTADFDGDGTPEVVINGNYSFHVLKASAKGTLRDLGEYKMPPRANTNNWPVSFATADFNGDGKLDLAVASSYSTAPDFVGVFLGNGDGTFREPVVFETEQNTQAIAVADFNRDGKLDLVAVNYWPADNVQIIIGNGDGTFVWPSVYRVGPGTSSVAVADFNGDGIPDVVAANAGYYGDLRSSLSVLLGKGDGTLADPIRIDVPASRVFARDLDGDGIPDIAALDREKLRILSGQGDGTFSEPVATDFAYTSNGYNDGVILADLDGNGVPKFLKTRGGSPLKLPLVAVDDFNGDGKPDIIAVEGYGTAGVVYLFPQAVPTASTVSK